MSSTTPVDSRFAMAARVATLRVFDHDNLRTKVGEQAGSVLSWQQSSEIKYADVF
jgi:hypothetical protein